MCSFGLCSFVLYSLLLLFLLGHILCDILIHSKGPCLHNLNKFVDRRRTNVYIVEIRACMVQTIIYIVI